MLHNSSLLVFRLSPFFSTSLSNLSSLLSVANFNFTQEMEAIKCAISTLPTNPPAVLSTSTPTFMPRQRGHSKAHMASCQPPLHFFFGCSSLTEKYNLNAMAWNPRHFKICTRIYVKAFNFDPLYTLPNSPNGNNLQNNIQFHNKDTDISTVKIQHISIARVLHVVLLLPPLLLSLPIPSLIPGNH